MKNGGEFVGWEFQNLLTQCGIKDKPTTSRNPYHNAVCERLHQTVANVLHTTISQNPSQHINQATASIDYALFTTMHVAQCTTFHALGISSGALVLRRDIFLDWSIKVDLLQI